MISLWCTGSSLDNFPKDDAQFIAGETTTIGVNFFNLFEPEYRIFHDVAIAEWLNSRLHHVVSYGTKLVTNSYIPLGHIKQFVVEYLPYSNEPGARVVTFSSAIDYILANFPEEKVLVFGADFSDYTNYFHGQRRDPALEELTDIPNQKRAFEHVWQDMAELKKKHDFSRFINCSLESKADFFQKRDWREVINAK